MITACTGYLEGASLPGAAGLHLAANRQVSRRGVSPLAQPPDNEHYRMLVSRLLSGAVVPFLGAGVNLCGRPESTPWPDVGDPGAGHPQYGRYLPSGKELATHLAQSIGYPYEDSSDLLRVSQYVDVRLGSGPLYETLHEVFDADYAPTPVHRLLASLPSYVRARKTPGPRFFPLNVTTNYDTCLEAAFQEAGEPYDLLTYIADGPDRGRFRHTRPDGDSVVIAVPNSYSELRCIDRPVIAKIHGAVSRKPDGQDSFVITENHYIAYLSHTDIAKLIPINVATRMRKSHFLFLGYSLRDWNLRVILHRLWGDDGLAYNSWAIQPSPEPIEERAWIRRGVELLDAPRGLRRRARALPVRCNVEPLAMSSTTPWRDDSQLRGLPECPYRGLRPYSEADGEYFFGRDADRDLVIANLMATRLTVLYGGSGVGKSSLLQAGVARQLRLMSEGEFSYLAIGRAFVVYHASWRDDPLAALGASLREALPEGAVRDEVAPPGRPLSLELLTQVTLRWDADVYLLCDQFEEVRSTRPVPPVTPSPQSSDASSPHPACVRGCCSECATTRCLSWTA